MNEAARIHRRGFGAAAALPFAARAQQGATPVVGYLSGRSLASDRHLVEAFRQALKELGYVEGQTVDIEFRWAEGQLDRLPVLAAELVRRQVSVIAAFAVDNQVRAVAPVLSSVPVVFATGGDPVALGLGMSFNRPGGNATAVTVISAALWPKRLELLYELVTPATRTALLVNPNNQTAAPAIRELQAAARGIGQDLVILNARDEREFEPAFATLVQQKPGALVVADKVIYINRREKLVEFAARHAVPAIYGRREFPAAGGLISFGASTLDQYRQTGIYVGRILRGSKPAELPFLQPTRFELVINMKTAKALGLAVPNSMQLLADEVIE